MTQLNKDGTRLLCERPKCHAWLGDVVTGIGDAQYLLRGAFTKDAAGNYSPPGRWPPRPQTAPRPRTGGAQFSDGEWYMFNIVPVVESAWIICPLCRLKQPLRRANISTVDND